MAHEMCSFILEFNGDIHLLFSRPKTTSGESWFFFCRLSIASTQMANIQCGIICECQHPGIESSVGKERRNGTSDGLSVCQRQI